MYKPRSIISITNANCINKLVGPSANSQSHCKSMSWFWYLGYFIWFWSSPEGTSTRKKSLEQHLCHMKVRWLQITILILIRQKGCKMGAFMKSPSIQICQSVCRWPKQLSGYFLLLHWATHQMPMLNNMTTLRYWMCFRFPDLINIISGIRYQKIKFICIFI